MPEDIYSSEQKNSGTARISTSAPDATITRKKRKVLSTEQKLTLRDKLKLAKSKKSGSISPEKMKIWNDARDAAGVTGRRVGRRLGLLKNNPMAEERNYGQRGDQMRRQPIADAAPDAAKFQDAERRVTIPTPVAAPVPLSPIASLSNIGLERSPTVRRRK